MIDSDRAEATTVLLAHDNDKELGYIEGIQDAARAINRVVHAGLVTRQAGMYFAALDDVAKELDKLLARRRKA